MTAVALGVLAAVVGWLVYCAIPQPPRPEAEPAARLCEDCIRAAEDAADAADDWGAWELGLTTTEGGNDAEH